MSRKRINKCILPVHEESDHLAYSQMCKCDPIIVEYSRVRLYVHKEITPLDLSGKEGKKSNYLRSI